MTNKKIAGGLAGLVLAGCGLLAFTNCSASGSSSSPATVVKSGTCTSVVLPTNKQPINPVALLPADNNGVVLSIPSVAAGGTGGPVTGSLTLGIGTQSNNMPSGLTTLVADQYASFITVYNNGNGQGNVVYDGSFIDSGSNGIFFPGPSSLTPCNVNGNDSGFYCPTSTQNYMATQKDTNGANPVSVSFSAQSADAYAAAFPNGGVFPNLTGLACDTNSPNASQCTPEVDWGLPFFINRGVWVGLDTKSSSLGTGSYWAYNATTASPINIGSNAANVIPVSVGNCNFPDGENVPCVSVKVCTPGTSTCQTIPNILLDTGSFGLRVFSGALSIQLNQVTDSSGNAIAECAEFGSANTWGPVQTADIYLGGEPAVTAPIQVINNDFSNYPDTCITPTATAADAGFNGILGVGLQTYDCGTVCAQTAQYDVYFSCK